MQTLDPALRPFMNADRRFTAWPRRQRLQLATLQVVAGEFESGRRYSEREVTDLIGNCLTFGDATRVRRALVDWGFVGREADGSSYWLITTLAPAIV
ncbi:MAG: DUF2087 domain-containing protein [Dehalococcoidia bacterium]